MAGGRFGGVALALGAVGACAAPAPTASVSPAPAGRTGAVPAPPPARPSVTAKPKEAPAERDKVAVLPLDDEELFRAERAELRSLLASELRKRLQNLDVLPLSEVDAKLRSVSKKSGARCAFAAPAVRRAHAQGWLSTDVIHVLGGKNTPEELWVDIDDSTTTVTSLSALWQWKLPRAARYRAAFASLRVESGALGLLGGLATTSRKGSVTAHHVTLCENAAFGACTPQTRRFADRAEQLARCFASADEDDRDLLFDSRRCELADLDDLTGPDHRLETCVCGALRGSAGRSQAGRHLLQVHFEAPAVAGKPRPRLRVIDASDNLFAESDRETHRVTAHGKTQYKDLRRLTVDNLDALAAPLARCRPPRHRIVVAQLEVDETGNVSSAHVLSDVKRRATTRCIESALRHGAFDCTSDGNPATLRVALAWPERAPTQAAHDPTKTNRADARAR